MFNFFEKLRILRVRKFKVPYNKLAATVSLFMVNIKVMVNSTPFITMDINENRLIGLVIAVLCLDTCYQYYLIFLKIKQHKPIVQYGFPWEEC